MKRKKMKKKKKKKKSGEDMVDNTGGKQIGGLVDL